MATARKTAEAPEETPPEDPGSKSEGTPDRSALKDAIREVLAEVEAPGPKEAGIPEKELDQPTTLRQIEEAAERVVRKAQEALSPPKAENKSETKEKAEPERPPEIRNRLRELIWGKE